MHPRAFTGLLIGAATLVATLAAPQARGGEDALRTMTAAAPLLVPHTLQLELDYRASRKSRATRRFEPADFHEDTPGLAPVTWPRDNDMRARLVTPELRRTPLVGWIATNLYRNRRENGWCLEVDPGEGEYLVFYRLHL